VRYPPSLPVAVDGLPAKRADQAEKVAARVLSRLTGANLEPLDVIGGAPGQHDFDLVHDDGRRIAVEVTACIDWDAARFVDALERQASHHDVDRLHHSWELRLFETTQVRGLIDEMIPRLIQIEAAGVVGLARTGLFDDGPMVRFGSSHSDHSVPAAVSELLALGVDTAWASPRPGSQGSVEFIRRSLGGSGRTENLVTDEVDRAARNKVAVMSRAAAAEGSERHLFVWLDADFCGDVEFSLWSGYPDTARPPALPRPIDHAWVGCWSLTPGEGIGHVVIWEAARGRPWRYPDVLSISQSLYD